MKIETHHIPSSGRQLSERLQANRFPAVSALINSGECGFEGPVAVELAVIEEKDFFKVSGRLSMVLDLACARCLEQFRYPVDNTFELTYSNAIPKDLHKREAREVELTADQIGVLYFEGHTIDFTEAIQEQIVLAIPYRPLCQPQCNGLCAGCGVNLNQSSCQCTSRPADGPFAVLEKLKVDS